MPRILIATDRDARTLTSAAPGQGLIRRGPVAEVVTLSETDGIYTIRCTGDGIDECPSDIEPGDTWSSFEDCVQNAIRHIGNHESRTAPTPAPIVGVATLDLFNSAGHERFAVAAPSGGVVVVVEGHDILIRPGETRTALSESLTFEVRP